MNTLDTGILLRKAYVELLSLRPDQWKRRESSHGQALLSELRDALAANLGLSAQQIQEDCEYQAGRIRRPNAYSVTQAAHREARK